MPDITFIHPDGREEGFEAPEGVSLMQAATSYGIDGIVAECGGSAICATCHVYIDDAWTARLPAPDANELDMLDATAAERRAGSRLSCQIRLDASLQGLVVHLPDRQY
ncbi:2Fe-2S iron-sulfur cluster-binding protein [Pseudorhodoferax sp.]|uniref:2Fe-2S iron-sulfur cluster-binding protein n=1 Tax=Pseudorhodoferax sp. TaxID=1993553 RepID=UPI002DD6B617|nr:2Fe-2S iron-sulfur cluster-binding protein [Pseudorhodoferax sp.]